MGSWVSAALGMNSKFEYVYDSLPEHYYEHDDDSEQFWPTVSPPKNCYVHDDEFPLNSAPTKRKETIANLQLSTSIKLQKMNDAKHIVSNMDGVPMDKEFWKQHVSLQENYEHLPVWEQLLHAIDLLQRYDNPNQVSKITQFHRSTLEKYSRIWSKVQSQFDTARFSEAELRKKSEEAFQFEVEHEFKPGPRIAGFNANLILEARRLNDEFIDKGDGGSISTQRLVESNCVIPAIMLQREKDGFNTLPRPNPLSKTALSRAVNAICPVKKPLTKTANGHEEDCRTNALGAFTEVALLPIALQGVHPHCIISQDSCSMYLGDDVPDHCWITEETNAVAKKTNRAMKTDGAVQRRTFRMHAGIAPGLQPLIFCQGIICDRQITEIVSFEIMSRVRIVFCPYSADSEKNAIDPGDEDSDLFGTFEKTLARRIASHILAKCIDDARAYRQTLRDDVIRMMGSNCDYEMFLKMLFMFDGESGPLSEVCEHYGELHEREDMSWFKHSNKHSKTVQPNDLAPAMHAGWKRAVRSDAFLKFSAQDIDKQVQLYPGMKAAITHLNNKQSMSPASRQMFRKAIAFLPVLLSRHVTVAVVQKAFADAKIHPLNEAEMFSNMYSPFAKLSQAEALECLRITQGPLREIGQSRIPRGIIWASEVQDHVQSSELIKDIVNVSTARNIDGCTLNRQGACWITSDIRHLQHERRDQAALQVATAQQNAADKIRKESEAKARLKHCLLSHELTDMLMKYTCRCGGIWLDGLKGFLAHEKLVKHQKFYDAEDCELVYKDIETSEAHGQAAVRPLASVHVPVRAAARGVLNANNSSAPPPVPAHVASLAPDHAAPNPIPAPAPAVYIVPAPAVALGRGLRLPDDADGRDMAMQLQQSGMNVEHVVGSHWIVH
jgi:hypothetical protein